MSAAAANAEAPAAKPKSKKLLIIIVGVLVLALAGAGAAFFLLKKNTADEDLEEDAETSEAGTSKTSKVDPKTPPTFLPLDPMVVNLADPGGNRFVQIGITLQLQDSATGDSIKLYMPSIRNDILMLISQRTADELLQLSGKEKLTAEIIAAVSNVMGYEIEEPEEAAEGGKKKRRRIPPNPVQGVLFSSLIVQ